MKRFNYVKVIQQRRTGKPLTWEGWVYARKSEAAGIAYARAMQEKDFAPAEEAVGWSVVMR